MNNLKEAGAHKLDAVLAMQAGDAHIDLPFHLDQ